MIKDMWLNLPVKDVPRSRKFYQDIGFKINEKYDHGNTSASLMVGEKEVIVMLFDEKIFQSFTKNKVVSDPDYSEIIISFSTETRAAVDAMAEKVRATGAKLYQEPTEMQGWMYGFAFTDPDGHKWNMLYMDMSKMPG
ncbi:VOC family protein [Flavihumibacter petaseus]|uniref:VOC domain-containing protein n=1 Tax=Flavihumibacter petaseus NBRC 106054 TaxID=1220578 RepID=A0A0E9MUD6_9BACT|nr:VOC family protein [Flavihumibacter petaseus]GAO41031.1 hypothetical protein FPE01S_01_00430 [Flavihumibacter petaseus NBRC 106054]